MYLDVAPCCASCPRLFPTPSTDPAPPHPACSPGLDTPERRLHRFPSQRPQGLVACGKSQWPAPPVNRSTRGSEAWSRFGLGQPPLDAQLSMGIENGRVLGTESVRVGPLVEGKRSVKPVSGVTAAGQALSNSEPIRSGRPPCTGDIDWCRPSTTPASGWPGRMSVPGRPNGYG